MTTCICMAVATAANEFWRYSWVIQRIIGRHVKSSFVFV